MERPAPPHEPQPSRGPSSRLSAGVFVPGLLAVAIPAIWAAVKNAAGVTLSWEQTAVAAWAILGLWVAAEALTAVLLWRWWPLLYGPAKGLGVLVLAAGALWDSLWLGAFLGLIRF